MKTIIFDLKNTLIDNEGEWIDGALESLKQSLNSDAKTILYSMNEPWTYEVLNEYKDVMSQIDQLLLVSSKVANDLTYISGGAPASVLVVGDSMTEEILFATQLGYTSANMTNGFPVEAVNSFVNVRETL